MVEMPIICNRMTKTKITNGFEITHKILKRYFTKHMGYNN